MAKANDLVLFSRGGEIYVIRADGSGERRLTRRRAKEIAPTGSSDGRTIAFASDRGGKFEIYLMNADGSRQRDSASGIYVVNTDGRERRMLTQP